MRGINAPLKDRPLDAVIWHSIGVAVTFAGIHSSNLFVALLFGVVSCQWAKHKAKFVRRIPNERS